MSVDSSFFEKHVESLQAKRKSEDELLQESAAKAEELMRSKEQQVLRARQAITALGLEGSLYLQNLGMRPMDQVQVITQTIESGWFFGRRIRTTPVTGWILDIHDVSHSEGEGWQSKSWTSTEGVLLAKSGDIHSFVKGHFGGKKDQLYSSRTEDFGITINMDSEGIAHQLDYWTTRVADGVGNIALNK